MKKVGIVTLSDFNNYGNRLQNYALEKVLLKQMCYVESIVAFKPSYIKFGIKNIILNKKHSIRIRILDYLKLKNFMLFDKMYVNTISVNKDEFDQSIANKYDYCIVGSDQVWNPTWAEYTYEKMFLKFCDEKKRVAYAASFGCDEIPDEWKERYKNGLLGFEHVSVREDNAVQLVMEMTGKLCQKVLDPTMLLTKEEWEEIIKFPENRIGEEDYILTYFLGEKTETIQNTIGIYSKKYGCKIINLLDINDRDIYVSGPSEFLGLISRARLILTDSFHATVFSIIFERPFVVFDRQGSGSKMGSRITSLLELCDMNDRRFSNIEENKLFRCNLSEKAKDRIKIEKIKSMAFLKEALQ